MKSILTKKALVIASVVGFIAITAIIIAFATGNTSYPELSDPDAVFYQRLDDDGNVVYTITNEELYEEIKSNDGVSQLLLFADSILLEDYILEVTDDEIDEKILELKFGTSDAEDLAELDAELEADYIEAFEQSMTLAGFSGKEEVYAALLVARENFIRDYNDDEDTITDLDVIYEYINGYYTDITAIKINFTSSADADFVMGKFNLVSLGGLELRQYNGYYFQDETVVDGDDEVAEALISVDVYYFDEDENILDEDGDEVYTYGSNSIYTDDDDFEYRLMTNGDLEDGSGEVVISNEVLFDTEEDALDYKEANTEYFMVTRTDPYDMDEIIDVVNSSHEVVYTIDSDGHIWNAAAEDVTYTTDLEVNKTYAPVEDLVTVTSNNSSELTDEEILAKYILMYNYVYSVYRDIIPEGSTLEDLIASTDENLHFVYDDLLEVNPVLTDYMFNDLSIADDEFYSQDPESLSGDSSGYYYLVYKVSEETKIDILGDVLDLIAPLVVIPTVIGDDISLPTSSYYYSTVSWESEDTDVISNYGVVTTPDEDTDVVMTYTITVFGKSEEYTTTVTVLADGDTIEVTDEDYEETDLEALFDDDAIYTEIYNYLLDDYIYGDDGEDNISSDLAVVRAELGIQIYDRYLALDYSSIDSTYSFDKGDKVNLISFDETLDEGEGFSITADEFFEYVLELNPALYTIYAAQVKELLATDYYQTLFGDEYDYDRNNSDRMTEMYEAVQSTKDYYVYLAQVYAGYGMSLGYDSFMDYAYAQYGTKTEFELLEYFITGEIQPFLIQEVIEQYDIVEGLYDSVLEYYESYFSLYVSHVLIYIDFDDDGSPDDFFEYSEDMTEADETAFNALLAGLERAIDEYDGTFSALVSEYNNATREDETWGEYKQNGFLILTEELNGTDDDGVTHSLTYSGEYGVMDSFVEEYVDALIALYQDYQLDQNLDKDVMYSNLVTTEFGLHVIMVGQGDDFDQPSAMYPTETDIEEDNDTSGYDDAVYNASDIPTVEQLEVYATYKYLAMVYDLTDTEIEETYGITIPDIPTDLMDVFEVYFDDLVSDMYVLGTININMAERLTSGEFLSVTYTDLTDDDLMSMMSDVWQVYFDSLIVDYATVE